MKCQNCGENDANVKYTQIINGIRKQMNLCDECAKELGIGDIEFNMPSFSDFFDDMFDIYEDTIPMLTSTKTLTRPKQNIKVEKLLSNKELKDNNYKETKEDKLKKLEQKLECEIKEERYEDAAKTRDEIKKIKDNGGGD